MNSIPTDLQYLKEEYKITHALLQLVREAYPRKVKITGVNRDGTPKPGSNDGFVVNNRKFIPYAHLVRKHLQKAMGQEAFNQWNSRFATATAEECRAMWANKGEWI